MRKALAVYRKELRQIVRDRRTLLILVFVPAFFLLLYGLAAKRFPMVSPRLAESTLSYESHHVVDPHEFLHEEPSADFVSEEAIEKEKRG